MSVAKQDLTRFLKKDIINYLDRLSPNEDNKKNTALGSNLELLKDAVQNKNWKESSKYFEYMIEEYNDISPTDIYKEVNFDKIFEAYKFCKDKELGGDIKDYIKLLEEEKIGEGEVPNTISVLEIKKEKEQKAEFEETEKDYDKKNELDNQIEEYQKQLFLAIRKEDISSAVKNYKKIKACFHKYPSRFEEDKENIYDDLLSLYVQIQKLSKKISGKDEIKNQDNTEVFNAEKYKKLVSQAKNEAKQGNYNKAKETVIDIKHLTSTLPREKQALHAMLDQKIHKLQHAIQVAKRISEENKKEEIIQ